MGIDFIMLIYNNYRKLYYIISDNMILCINDLL